MPFLVFWLGPAAMGALLLLAWVARAHWGAWAHRQRAQGAVDKSRSRSPGVERMQGKLIVVGKGAPSSTAAHKIAATTQWGSRRRVSLFEALPGSFERAQEIWLDLGTTRTRLDGTLLVESGSKLTATAKPTFVDHRGRYEIVTSVCDGDEVTVLGKPGEDVVVDGHSGEYRGGASGKAITAVSEMDPIRLVARARPRVSLSARALFLQPLFFVALLLGVAPGYALSGQLRLLQENRDMQCRELGECHIDSKLRWLRLRAIAPLAKGDFLMLAAHDTSDCRRSAGCREDGRCTPVGGHCVASSDEDCSLSLHCADWAHCSLVHSGADTSCGVAKDGDCEHSSSCASWGGCSALDGICIAGKDEDCRRTESCREYGQCSARSGQCIAANDSDCKQTPNCSLLGNCVAANASCTTSDPTCRASKDCREEGRCSNVAGGCRANAVADCVASDDCAARHRCSLSDHECVDDQLPCASSEACLTHGRCGGTSYCEARSDADCAKSTECKTSGKCKKYGPECAESCATTELCRLVGACTDGTKGCEVASAADCERSDSCKQGGVCNFVDGRCVASDASCARSERCKSEGKCSANESKTSCVAKSSADCKQHVGCASRGDCTFHEGRCELTSDADCAATRACADEGKCAFEPGAHCILGAADCRKRPPCKEQGDCSVVSEPGNRKCGAIDPSDCRDSVVCQRFGWCDVVDGHCFVAAPAPKP